MYENESLFVGQGSIIPIPVEYLRRFKGDFVTAALLSQIVFWDRWSRNNGRDGWFWKTYSEWMEFFCLGSQHTISRAKTKLENLGIIEVKNMKTPDGTPKNHWRIKIDGYNAWCAETTMQNVQDAPCKKCRDDYAECANTSITENTNRDNNNSTSDDVQKKGFKKNWSKEKKEKAMLFLSVCEKYGKLDFGGQAGYWRVLQCVIKSDLEASRVELLEKTIDWHFQRVNIKLKKAAQILGILKALDYIGWDSNAYLDAFNAAKNGKTEFYRSGMDPERFGEIINQLSALSSGKHDEETGAGYEGEKFSMDLGAEK